MFFTLFSFAISSILYPGLRQYTVILSEVFTANDRMIVYPVKTTDCQVFYHEKILSEPTIVEKFDNITVNRINLKIGEVVFNSVVPLEKCKQFAYSYGDIYKTFTEKLMDGCFVAFGDNENFTFSIILSFGNNYVDYDIGSYDGSILTTTHSNTYNINKSSIQICPRVSDKLEFITIYDNSKYNIIGDHEISINETKHIKIIPNSIFVAKNVNGFDFSSNHEEYRKAVGVYYAENHPVTITVKSSNPENVLYFVIDFKKPNLDCTSYSVMIAEENYSLTNDKFESANKSACILITSPNSMLYKFSYAYDSKYSYQTAFFKLDLNYTHQHGLIRASIFWDKDIISRSDKWIPIIGELKQPSFEHNGNFSDEIENDNNIQHGFYSVFIPSNNKIIIFQRETLIIFHNPYSFEGKLYDGDKVIDILGDSQNYVINLTTNNPIFSITRKQGSNISVLNFTVDKRNTESAFTDVIVVSSNSNNYFLCSSDKTYDSKPRNISLQHYTSLSLQIHSSGDMHYYRDYTLDFDIYHYHGDINLKFNFSDNEPEHRVKGYLYIYFYANHATEDKEISGLFTGASSFTGSKYAENYAVSGKVLQVGDVYPQYDGKYKLRMHIALILLLVSIGPLTLTGYFCCLKCLFSRKNSNQTKVLHDNLLTDDLEKYSEKEKVENNTYKDLGFDNPYHMN